MEVIIAGSRGKEEERKKLGEGRRRKGGEEERVKETGVGV